MEEQIQVMGNNTATDVAIAVGWSKTVIVRNKTKDNGQYRVTMGKWVIHLHIGMCICYIAIITL